MHIDKIFTIRWPAGTFPAEIINHVVWLSLRFYLSFRDLEALLFVYGVVVTYEAIHTWCGTYGHPLRPRRRAPSRRLPFCFINHRLLLRHKPHQVGMIGEFEFVRPHSRQVAQAYGQRVEDLVKPTRRPSEARQVGIYAARRVAGGDLKTVARRFGLGYTAVSRRVGIVANRLRNNPRLRSQVEKLYKGKVKT